MADRVCPLGRLGPGSEPRINRIKGKKGYGTGHYYDYRITVQYTRELLSKAGDVLSLSRRIYLLDRQTPTHSRLFLPLDMDGLFFSLLEALELWTERERERNGK